MFVTDPRYEDIIKDYGDVLPIQVPTTHFQETMFWDLFAMLYSHVHILPKYIEIFQSKKRGIAITLSQEQHAINPILIKFDSLSALFRRWIEIIKGNQQASANYKPTANHFILLKILHCQIDQNLC
jgi:hypothetical protein